MAKLESAFFDLSRLETLSRQQTGVHKLDPRAKILTTAVFLVTVMSFGRYDLSAIVPFFLYPMVMMGADRCRRWGEGIGRGALPLGSGQARMIGRRGSVRDAGKHRAPRRPGRGAVSPGCAWSRSPVAASARIPPPAARR